MRARMNKDAASGDTARGQKRLQFLLKQAEVFQHFAPVESEKGKKKGRHAGVRTEEQEDEAAEAAVLLEARFC